MHIRWTKVTLEKVKLNWIFYNEFIYFFFPFCNKTKRENDVWTNEFTFVKGIKKIQIYNSFNYFSLLSMIHRIIHCLKLTSNKISLPSIFFLKQIYAFFSRLTRKRKVPIDLKTIWKIHFFGISCIFTGFVEFNSTLITTITLHRSQRSVRVMPMYDYFGEFEIA